MSSLRGKIGHRPDAAALYHSIVSWEREHVRASVVELSEGAAELVGVASAALPSAGREGRFDPDLWFASCDKALTQAEDMTGRFVGHQIVPDYVTMGVPADMTRTVSIALARQRQEARAAVTPDEMRTLLERGYRKAQDILGTRDKDADEDIIHGSVAEVLMDGQAVGEPVGLHGEQVELRMSFCVAPLGWIRALESLAERLKLRLTALVPQHVALACALPDAAALLVLLDAHSTSLSLVRHGLVEWAALVDVGEQDMTGATAAALDLRGRQAEALMRAYRAGQLREEIALQVAKAFWEQLRAWMTALGDGAWAVAPDAVVPQRVYFWDATRRMPEALDALKTPFWERALRFGRCPEVLDLEAHTVRDVLDRTAQAVGPAFMPLRALARYAAQLYGPSGGLERMCAELIHWRRPTTKLRST